MPDKTGRVLYIVRTWVPEDRLEEWNRWHTQVHVPEVAAQPQVHRARKYRVAEDNTPAEWSAQYVTIYEFDTWEEWQIYNNGPEAVRLRKDYTDHYGSVGNISRQVLVETDDGR
jgi:hypothetical protein